MIRHVSAGGDALLLLPTGGGKSLCYQIPTLMGKGNCLVVSPLLALMKDQQRSLQEKGIPSLWIHSGMHAHEIRSHYEAMTGGGYRFLFVSPERLRSVLFLDYLTDWNIQLIAVDEAHCISQWGYDFRPAYLDIASLRSYLPDAACIAMTASATKPVQEDIVRLLALRQPQLFSASFYKPQLAFSIYQAEHKPHVLAELLQQNPGSSLVYCRSRKRTVEMAAWLNQQGVQADAYHAGLAAGLRAEKQEQWMSGRIPVMVCTNAFGMGIDKADVRTVIHYDIPDTPEAYYQEAGRAGRDEKAARAILLIHPHDLTELKQQVGLKYPDVPTMRKVYEALALYFQIGLHSGADTTFSLDLVHFAQSSRLPIPVILSTIRLLEQQQYWVFHETVTLPSRVMVTCATEELETIARIHPEMEEMLEVLLRTYGGILQQYTAISEWEIARTLGVSLDYVRYRLQQLHEWGLLDYLASGELPQLHYLHDRIETHLLQIDTRLLEWLRERYRERVQVMLRMVSQTDTCRARYLLRYFGEEPEKDCGTCDRCLQKKFEQHRQDILTALQENILHELQQCESLAIDLLLKQHPQIPPNEIMQLIRYLATQEIIRLDADGKQLRRK